MKKTIKSEAWGTNQQILMLFVFTYGYITSKYKITFLIFQKPKPKF